MKLTLPKKGEQLSLVQIIVLFASTAVLCILAFKPHDIKKPDLQNNKVSSTEYKQTLDEDHAGVVARLFLKAKMRYEVEFPYSPPIVRASENIYSVADYAQVANMYNAKSREFYSCRLKYNGGDWSDYKNWEVQYMALDGVKIYPAE